MFRRKLIYGIVLFLTEKLSRRKFILIGKMISLIYYAFGIKSKSIVKENLKHNHIKFSIKLYLNFAHFLCENIYLLSNELDENIFELHNIELFNRAVKSDKGVMLLSFHYGGWDISGQLLSKYGYPINVIYENKKEWIYEYLDKLRKKYNTTLINRDSPVNIFLEILNKGEVLTVFIDQQSNNLALKTVKFLNISKAVPSGWYKLLKISKV
ncbi:lysophospholipid acyltransferase family protein, partial [candidate division WOR-3 bacterium]|nr:lysophospholipid acyltransferase family protein [candidate division WOR-3 bacterium]